MKSSKNKTPKIVDAIEQINRSNGSDHSTFLVVDRRHFAIKQFQLYAQYSHISINIATLSDIMLERFERWLLLGGQGNMRCPRFWANLKWKTHTHFYALSRPSHSQFASYSHLIGRAAIFGACYCSLLSHISRPATKYADQLKNTNSTHIHNQPNLAQIQIQKSWSAKKNKTHSALAQNITSLLPDIPLIYTFKTILC